jgi:DNA-binding NarL/FixJ family response regulator
VYKKAEQLGRVLQAAPPGGTAMSVPAEVGRPEAHPARPPIRVAIMGGHQLTRHGMRLALETQPDLLVTADFPDTRAPADPQRWVADVVLLDPVHCRCDAAAMVAGLRDSGCRAKVVVLTDDSCDCIEQVLCAGASGVVLKDDGPDQLAQALRSVSAGYLVLPACIAATLWGPEGCCRHQAPEPARPVPDSERARTGLLTRRERDVLRGLMAGASNAEIALSLHLGVGTVKAHVQHLLAKLEVRNRQQAVVYAYEVGFGVAPVELAPPRRPPPAGTGPQ